MASIGDERFLRHGHKGTKDGSTYLRISDRSRSILKKSGFDPESYEKPLDTGENLIGELLAKRAKEKNISEVYFDRGAYKFHGRIKAFAETLRKNGLKF